MVKANTYADNCHLGKVKEGEKLQGFDRPTIIQYYISNPRKLLGKIGIILDLRLLTISPKTVHVFALQCVRSALAFVVVCRCL